MSGDDLPTEWVYYKPTNLSGEINRTSNLQEAIARSADKERSIYFDYVNNEIRKFSDAKSSADFYISYVNKIKEDRGYTEVSVSYGDESFGYKMNYGGVNYFEIVYRKANLVITVSYTSDLSIPESTVKDLASKIENKLI